MKSPFVTGLANARLYRLWLAWKLKKEIMRHAWERHLRISQENNQKVIRRVLSWDEDGEAVFGQSYCIAIKRGETKGHEHRRRPTCNEWTWIEMCPQFGFCVLSTVWYCGTLDRNSVSPGDHTRDQLDSVRYHLCEKIQKQGEGLRSRITRQLEAKGHWVKQISSANIRKKGTSFVKEK